MSETYRIKNSELEVEIAALGAELQSIRLNGQEYLWQGNTKYWGERAPNLFPYIGRLPQGEYIYNGKKYRLDIHGFVKDSVLQVKSKAEDTITLVLPVSPERLLQYPFNCIYYVKYTVSKNTLLVKYTVMNTGNKAAYFGIGGHPGFQMPMMRQDTFEDYYLEFEETCFPAQIIFSEDNFVQGKALYHLEEGKILRLNHAMFNQDAIVLQNTSSAVTIKSERYKGAVRVEFAGFPYIGLWKMPKTDAPYVCIEPWSSLPAQKGAVTEIMRQKDLLKVEAKQQISLQWKIEIKE